MFGFAIDRGGTFTDVYARRPDGTCRILKLLSEDTANYSDAPTEAIRRILQQETGKQISRGTLIPTDGIAWIRMGTTVATNALLERKGERTVLAITKGFKDLLFIGNQSRPRIFDFDIRVPDVLYEDVIEIDERIVLADETCELNLSGRRDIAINGEQVIVEREVDEEVVANDLRRVFERGIRSLAVVFLHSYKFPNHEKIVGEIAKKIGFTNVSLSSDVMPMVKIVPRGYTACVDAYLTPKIQHYISSFREGFVGGLKGVNVQFMQSNGGLCPVENFFGSKAILSGPAAGVVGVSLTSFDRATMTPVIGFDMGGTSTDVCRYAGEFAHVMETTTAGVTVQAPQLDIHTVAAGGGSRLFFRSGLFVVGPESSGATPGPVCYRKGGYLAITDANLILGRILPQYFPQIFGPHENEPLDKDAAVEAMWRVADEVNAGNGGEGDQRMSVEEIALGFIDVANETMCRAIRSITQAKGYDTSQHILACFGGAGGQHACAVAKSLGISTVLVHRYAGILSAYGLALADVVHEAQEPACKSLSRENFEYFDRRFAFLKEKCSEELHRLGFTDDSIRLLPFLHLRYARTDCAIMCLMESNDLMNFVEVFERSYQQEFGFTIPDREIIVDDIRVRGVGVSGMLESRPVVEPVSDAEQPPRVAVSKCYFKEGNLDTNVYNICDLKFGHKTIGPAIIVDANSTILVEPGCTAHITDEGNVMILVGRQREQIIGAHLDSIQLSIFSQRFMSIAEQMGLALQRTAISTNIKERLDFSCALFGPDGGLVANAPHIPVHLGGMQATVRFQIDHLGVDGMPNGCVILCNHPKAGGSHLPDLTVITPVYYHNSERPVFYVANRGHHADIGGLVPGSMPPHSTSLDQEGAIFVSLKVVEKGRFQEEEVTKQLNAPGLIRGCSGTRNLSDNLSDLKAQISANQKGVGLVCELIDCYGLEVVQAYMKHIQDNAEQAVRNLLKKVGRKQKEETGSTSLCALDFMDDGTPIQLEVKIDEEKGEAVFDFEGTGEEVYSSCNAPPAVTMAAVMYCLRCLTGTDIPLNRGCITPIKIKVPSGTILSPSDNAAVVGGNVLTSQRICDVILLAFKAVAASQGCMNNVTFGDEKMGGYYETVAGGAGAGPGFHGRSAVHTHMTNTRITDPEILESRYPVILWEFSVREGSGGDGEFRGGNGCVRRIQFRRPLHLSLLTERRAFVPYGLAGGCPGKRGINLLYKKFGRIVNLGGKISLDVDPGDVFELRTPGGGGYGSSKQNNESQCSTQNLLH